MSARTTTTTDVEIFGAVYHVRGEKNPEYLQELAAIVDRKMREIAGQVATVDSTKIAILAALNFADELNQGQRRKSEDPEEFQRKIESLTEQLAGALGE